MIAPPSRRAVLRGSIAAAAALFAGGAYASWIEPVWRLGVTRYAPRPAGWPAGRHLTIAALADIHAAAPHMSLARIGTIVDRTNALGADLIVLLGDYAPGHRFVTEPVPARALAGALRRLQAPLGVYGILGNHDWWDDRTAQRLRRGPPIMGRELQDAGIAMIENGAVRLVKDGRPFWLMGLGDQLALPSTRGWIGVDDLPATLSALTDDAPAILLAHEPDIFPKVPRRVALTLSGHTHGGQVRLFGYSPVVPSRYGNRYAYGHVVEDGRHLIVSGGLGQSIMPVRFGVPPEILLIELGAGDAA